MMNNGKGKPRLDGVGAAGNCLPSAGGSGTILVPSLPNVKKGDGAQLVDQALASELRALACAAWHRERAGRYLAYCDSPWAAAQYAGHVSEAAYQDALAARHRQIAAALGEVRP